MRTNMYEQLKLNKKEFLSLVSIFQFLFFILIFLLNFIDLYITLLPSMHFSFLFQLIPKILMPIIYFRDLVIFYFPFRVDLFNLS